MARKAKTVFSLIQIAKLQEQTQARVEKLQQRQQQLAAQLAGVTKELAGLTGEESSEPAPAPAPKAKKAGAKGKKAAAKPKAKKRGKKKRSVNDIIFSVIEQAGGVAQKKAIVAALVKGGFSKGTGDPALSGLKKVGKVKNVGLGKWSAA